MLQKTIKVFDKGLIDRLESRAIPDGALSASKNWVTKGDKMELRRGYKILGTENSGTGKITGLHVTRNAAGTEIPVRTRDRKIEYYTASSDTWTEISTNVLDTLDNNADVSFADYVSRAGYQLWISAPNSGLIKILTANMGSHKDNFDSTKNYEGRIRIKLNRMFLWNRVKDKSGVYLSYIDTETYTTVTAEALSDTASGTLAAVTGIRTCFGVSITDTSSGEVFTDNYDGTLTGSAGGTGTINYSTGAFTTNQSGAGEATYQWENSTTNGIADFTKSATRTAGQGAIFRQDDNGGNLQTVLSYKDTEYCIHEFKTWGLTLGRDDTTATNLIFRGSAGIPNWRAAVETEDGIYYIDDVDENDPRFRLMSYDEGSDQVIPIEISSAINLTDYRFDKCASIRYGNLILFAARHKDSTENNVVFVFDKVWKSFDVFDYNVNCFAIYDGSLLGGDSLSDNVMVLFSGFDDNGSKIANYIESKKTNLEADGVLKKTKRLIITGEISKDQIIKVYAALDNKTYTYLGNIVGTGAYVDKTQAVTIGALTLGRGEVGGGGGSINAYNYVREFKLGARGDDTGIDKFEDIKLKFEATELGYASVSTINFQDIRLKNNKIPRKYR